MEFNDPLNSLAANQELFNRLIGQLPKAAAAGPSPAASVEPAKDGFALTAPAPAGVTYERFELDYLNVKLIEQGIRGENQKAASSLLSVEAVHLTYERWQISSGPQPAADAAGTEEAVAQTMQFSLTSAEYDNLEASIGKKLSKAALKDFLKEYMAELMPDRLAPADNARPPAGKEEQDGLTSGQEKDLRSLELLLRTFTKKSAREIRETIRNIAGALREANGQDQATPGDTAAAAAGDRAEAAGSAAATLVEATSVQVEVKIFASGKIDVRKVQDPLVIDLDGDGIELTDAASGVDFDLTGDGEKERTGTVATDDALLAYDRNGNGAIDSGRELFGDQHGAANGFAELKKFDANGDARIDAGDAVFSGLQLWTDRNTNGLSENSELRGLKEAGITAINLDYRTYDIKGEKNALNEAAAVEFADGRKHAAADVNIAYSA